MCRTWKCSCSVDYDCSSSFPRAPHLAPGAFVLARPKRHCGPRLKDDIRASPRLIVSQPPAMSAADRILGEQDVARTDEEVLPLARLEIERPTQGYDQLPDGRVVPGEGAARSRLLKGDRRRRHFAAQHVAALSGPKLNDALLEMRVFVVSRPYSYTPDHGPAPDLAAAFALRDFGPPAVERGSTGRNGTAVAWSRMAYMRLHGCSPISFQSWPVTVSSPARSEKGPSCVMNTSAPLSVMTS